MSDPITKTIVVDADPETAFRTWVEDVDSWWPKSHSRSRDPATRIVIETRSGGRFYEQTPDGNETDFGSILTYDPPGRLVYHWFLGTDAHHPTVVEITFVSVPDGTRVDVEHRAGEAGAEAWDRRKSGYDGAWADVLTYYENAFASGATT